MKSKINTKSIMQVFWKHVRPYKLHATIILILVVITKTADDIIVPIFFKRFFDLLGGEIQADPSQVPALLVGTLIIILALRGVGWLSWRIIAFTNAWFQPRVMADITQSSHDYLHKHSYRFFSNSFTGSLVRRVNRLSRSFEDFADQIMFVFVPLVVTVVGTLVVVYTRSPFLSGILLVWVFFYLVFNIAYAKWKTKFDFEKSKIDSETTGVLADSITNATTVKLFTGHEYETGLYKTVTEKLRRARTFTWSIGEVMDAAQAFLMVFIEFILLYYTIQFWQEGLLTIGDFALMQAYLIGLFQTLWNIGRAIRRTYEALADADEMVEILNEPLEVQDSRNAKQLDVQTGRIEFKNVYFSFQKTRRVLKDFNLLIKPGEKIALVGPSGAGKSTVTKLLFRFYDLERGKIFVGNQNIAKVTQESLREQIALVPQEPILFHRSVMDNIRYGRRDATDEQVMEAAKRAYAHEFIQELPDGYGTFVGERGVKLSGGERQRVAIARAVLKDAPILVLDEATSSLDSESEALIQAALEDLMKDKTTIVIAHRLSTIMKMDRIIEIVDGKVADSGTHKQLLRKKNSIYKKLWDIQAGGFIQ
jgi:ATP-binding cassette, subfamily B, bacterial